MPDKYGIWQEHCLTVCLSDFNNFKVVWPQSAPATAAAPPTTEACVNDLGSPCCSPLSLLYSPPWGSYWPNCDSNCAAMRQSHIILNANMQQDTAAAVAEVSVQPFWPLPVLNLCTAHTHTTTHRHTHSGTHTLWRTPTSAETNCSFRVWLRQMEYLIKTCADKGCHPPSPLSNPFLLLATATRWGSPAQVQVASGAFAICG